MKVENESDLSNLKKIKKSNLLQSNKKNMEIILEACKQIAEEDFLDEEECRKLLE